MDFLNYLGSIDYPEYARERNGTSISADLLDLSMDDGQKVEERLLGIINKGKTDISRYSISQEKSLIKNISEYTSVEEDKIILTSGGDGALNIITRALIQPGTKVLIPLPSFGRFEYHVKVNRGEIYYMEPDGFPFDISIDKLIIELITTGAEVLIFANPNNPTGIYKPLDKLEMVLKSFGGYVVVDEVLGDYIDEDSAATLTDKYERLVVIKSFSKLFGLAGMRIGYMIGNGNIVSKVKKLVSPFEVNILAIKLANEILDNRVDILNSKRRDLLNSLKLLWKMNSHTLSISPSQSSTMLISSSSSQDLYTELMNIGVMTVPCRDFRGIEDSNSVRVAIKNYRQAKGLVDKLEAINKI